MLRRKIETQLEAWRSAPKRTALLVTGARQIGKTYITETHGRFSNHIRVNKT